jgi:hypothetical protein
MDFMVLSPSLRGDSRGHDRNIAQSYNAVKRESGVTVTAYLLDFRGSRLRSGCSVTAVPPLPAVAVAMLGSGPSRKTCIEA